jgi:hypothetical protein
VIEEATRAQEFMEELLGVALEAEAATPGSSFFCAPSVQGDRRMTPAEARPLSPFTA